MRTLFWMTTCAALGAAACAHDAELKPAPSAQQVKGDDAAAVKVASGVRMVVDGDAWTGTPAELEQVVPVRVTIENNSGRPLRLRYGEFSLRGPEGTRLAALPPFSIDGVALVDDPTADSAVDDVYGGAGLDDEVTEPVYDWSGFYTAPGYGPYWSGISPWSGPFIADPFYYDTMTVQWPVELPTESMVRAALPEGVLDKGGRVSGFLYFQDVPEGIERVTFRADLVDANTGEQFGTLTIPFRHAGS